MHWFPPSFLVFPCGEFLEGPDEPLVPVEVPVDSGLLFVAVPSGVYFPHFPVYNGGRF
jgi:hypothetical protein